MIAIPKKGRGADRTKQTNMTSEPKLKNHVTQGKGAQRGDHTEDGGKEYSTKKKVK